MSSSEQCHTLTQRTTPGVASSVMNPTRWNSSLSAWVYYWCHNSVIETRCGNFDPVHPQRPLRDQTFCGPMAIRTASTDLPRTPCARRAISQCLAIDLSRPSAFPQEILPGR
ncbi:hypothetical protein SCLCIDRAFT_1207261 [Scleroderma citrinum Foug A]|uniref:Uncharacterized protein n=1 Tax=Scleroderma citrinum Foug A TaxID=1036808 RepID=A0A0C3EB83_9AGAM|nr:hypothetical protein SCLCIDRAFT_1207261 [Scleroderma citrinum Foug A]